MQEVSSNKIFGGWHKQYTHDANSLNCTMRFAIFLPPQIETGKRLPVLYWLSGLTCTDENFMQKSGALKLASELGIVIVAPDTSPRGEGVPDDPDQSYDFGLGAGFYVNATQEPWNKHYQMYDYVSQELPELIEKNFSVSNKKSISGHSMGGHGALVVALNNSDRYSSVSAFSPVCHPTKSPWGRKALSHYLGSDEKAWEKYDSVVLMSKSTPKDHLPALVDQGAADNFLDEQLFTTSLKNAAEECDFPVEVRMQEGYDHSYYFISTFIEDHLRFHKKHLA